MSIKSALGRQLGTQFDTVFDVVKSHPVYDKSGGKIPSLDLNFAKSKSLRDSRSTKNKITFSRASSGTFVDSDGLIKTTPVNKLLHSEDFSQNAWIKSSISSITTGQLAPDNTNTAAKIAFNNVNNWYIYQDAGSVIGQPYVGHVYLKGSANATLGLRKPGRGDTSIGSFGTLSISVTTEWQKFEAITTSADVTDGRLLVDGRNLNGASVPAGFELFIWHPQVEDGTTANPYIKTGATISGAPRFDHDPATGESLGLLIEESRTNLVTYSEEFDQSAWSKTNSAVIPNVSDAPDGSQTADSFVQDSTVSSAHYLNQTSSVTSGATYTFSVHVKYVDWQYINLDVSDGAFGSSARATFDLINGTVVDGSNGIDLIQNVGNGWYRISMSVPATATSNSDSFISFNNGTSFSNTFNGDGTSSVLVWGAQLERNSFASSYIPTTSSTVTRAADIVEITSTNFSSFYNQSEGTVYVETVNYPDPVTGKALTPFAYSDNSYNNRIYLAGSTGTSQFNFDILASGSSVRAILGNFTSGGVKSAGGYKATGSAASLNGANVVTSSTPNIPTVINRLDIGKAHNGVNFLGGHIKRLIYFNTRLSDDKLKSITS